MSTNATTSPLVGVMPASGAIAAEPTALNCLFDRAAELSAIGFLKSECKAPPRPRLIVQYAGPVAVVDITGVIVLGSAPEWAMRWGLAIGHDDIRAALADAKGADDVRALILSFDSPGGSASQLSSLAADIRATDAVIPAYAHGRGMMASAAYYIASQTRRIYAEPEATVGSIGTMLPHYDYRAMLERDGIKADPIASGKLKSAGMYGTSLASDQRKMLQQVVDDAAGLFFEEVARGRNLSVEFIRSLEAGFGLAGWALAKSLIDEIAHLPDAVSRIVQALPSDQQENGARNQSSVPVRTVKQPAPLTDSHRAMIRESLVGFAGDAYVIDTGFVDDALAKCRTVAEADRVYRELLGAITRRRESDRYRAKSGLTSRFSEYE